VNPLAVADALVLVVEHASAVARRRSELDNFGLYLLETFGPNCPLRTSRRGSLICFVGAVLRWALGSCGEFADSDFGPPVVLSKPGKR
jgi:hypothetical protein